MILFPEQAAPDFLSYEAQRRAGFLQVFARFVNGSVPALLLAFRYGDGALDLLATDPAQIIPERLTLP
jgi:hypothetical protein